MKRIVRATRSPFSFSALMLATGLATPTAQGAFHLWNLQEIYTDSSGHLQFIELSTPFSSQQFVSFQQIQVVNVGATQTHTFTMPSDLPGDTFNHTFLLGTAGLHAAGGPTPDYIIPDNFLFPGGGTINFFGANSGAYTALPTDGTLSRTWGDGNAVNSPRNFLSQSGVVIVPEPAVCLLLGAGVGILGLLGRRRSC